MLLLGILKLGQALFMKKASVRERLMKGGLCCLCSFGALLLVGVAFWIMKYPNFDLYMRIGLLGTAGSLSVVGLLRLSEVMMMEGEEDEEDGSGTRKVERDEYRRGETT